jgi:hypothetical protein
VNNSKNKHQNSITSNDEVYEHIRLIKSKLLEAKEKYEKDNSLTKPLTPYAINKLYKEKNEYTLAIITC